MKMGEFTSGCLDIACGMDINKLSLNLNKTKVMMFGNYKENSELSINIDGAVIECQKIFF